MPVQSEKPSNRALKPRKSETWEFRLIFFVSFIVFLAAALVERLLPGSRRGRAAAFQGKSIIAEAREAASTCTAFAFMG